MPGLGKKAPPAGELQQALRLILVLVTWFSPFTEAGNSQEPVARRPGTRGLSCGRVGALSLAREPMPDRVHSAAAIRGGEGCRRKPRVADTVPQRDTMQRTAGLRITRLCLFPHYLSQFYRIVAFVSHQGNRTREEVVNFSWRLRTFILHYISPKA